MEKEYIYPIPHIFVGTENRGGCMSSVYKRGRPKKIENNKQINKIPEVLGEYRIRDNETRAVYYVGISSNLRGRVYTHKTTGKFCEGRYLEYLTAKKGVTYEDVREHERKAILKYDPPENKRGGGAGRTPVVLVYLEEDTQVPVEEVKAEMSLNNHKRGVLHILIVLSIIIIIVICVLVGIHYYMNIR